MNYLGTPMLGVGSLLSPNDPLSFGYSDRQASAFNQRAAEESRAAEAARIAEWERLNGPAAHQALQQQRADLYSQQLRKDYGPATGYSVIGGQMYVKGQPVGAPGFNSNDARDYFDVMQREQSKEYGDRLVGFAPLGLNQAVFSDPRFQQLTPEQQEQVYGSTGRSLQRDLAAEELKRLGMQGPINAQDIAMMDLGAKAMGLPDARSAMLASRYNQIAQQSGLPAIPFGKPRDRKLEVETYRGMYGVHPGEAASAIEERDANGQPRYVVRSKDQYGIDVEVPIPVQAVIEGRRMIGAEAVPKAEAVTTRTPEQESRFQALIKKAQGTLTPSAPQAYGQPPSLMNDIKRIGAAFSPNNLESAATFLGGPSLYNSVAGAVNYPNRLWSYIVGQQPSEILPYDPGQQDYGFSF